MKNKPLPAEKNLEGASFLFYTIVTPFLQSEEEKVQAL